MSSESASPVVAPAAGGNGIAVSSRRGRFASGVILALVCFLVYSANFRAINVGDAYPARYLPFAIWKSGTVLLDPIVDIAAQGWTPVKPHRLEGLAKRVDAEAAYWVVRLPSGHLVSLYPIVVPLLIAPLYLPAVVYLNATGWDPLQFDRIARIMEKICASLLATLSAALLYQVLCRYAHRQGALLLTIAYAFGTTTWVISSQALWQHGVGQLLVVGALLLLTGSVTRGRAAAVGIVLALMVFNRPPDAFIAAALGVYALWWARRSVPILVAATLLSALPFFFYNLGIVGHVAGAYGLFDDTTFFENNLLTGLAGLLFSPTKGLFIFSPFLLFVPFCVPVILWDEKTRYIGIAVLCAIVAQLLLYSVADWRQGGSWGPRWLTDLLPLLVWLLIPVVTTFGRVARAAFLVGVGAGIVIEAIGAFWYTGASDAAVYASARESNPWRAAWVLENAPFIAELQHARAPFDLTADLRGFVDAVTVVHGLEGRTIDVDGWALADRNAPAEVVVLRDGHVAARTDKFGPRPDVSRALGSSGPTGWHVSLSTNDLPAGTHDLAVLLRPYAGSSLHLLAQRQVDLPAEPALAQSGSSLEASAHLAADVLASRQDSLGYWLTSYTTQPRFVDPHVELNTYLPSMMSDILAPVAEAAGLAANVQRARQFLSAQIEANGLVRYHGLATAPTIGTLGCAITPDADDTALVWRIAPASDRMALRDDALRTMADFRTPAGLYRTWLAPRDRYECINPGVDPDPADMAIQMHVLMLLSSADPPSAKTLCTALKQSVSDDRIWVYYALAPLVPMLRLADLREVGCSLQLPAVREQTTIAGQALWLEAARMLDRARNDGGGVRDPAEVRQWLENVASDEFSTIRRNPPLLYHNDLSASVSRYYWSQEFGYALWLRLYFALGPSTTGSQH